MQKDDVSGLTQLGSNETQYKYEDPCPQMLETFPNPRMGKEIVVDFTFPEFTSLCPKTGQPDFATINVKYVPKKKCLESKSVKLYFFAWRRQGCFMESIVAQILDDFVEACDPLWMRVEGDFNPRGGLKLVPAMEYRAHNWKGLD